MPAPALFPCTIVRSRQRRKTLSLELRRDGSVVVRVPAGTGSEAVTAFLEKKQAWLTRKLAERAALDAAVAASRDRLWYLGFAHPLRLAPQECEAPGLAFTAGGFVLRCRDEACRADVIAAWYRRQAADYFAARTAHHAARTGLAPAGLRISGAAHRWGSCSPANRVSLTWRLLMAPPAVIDYVILHELAHLRERNHGPRFRRLVAALAGDTEGPRRWLREHAPLLWP